MIVASLWNLDCAANKNQSTALEKSIRIYVLMDLPCSSLKRKHLSICERASRATPPARGVDIAHLDATHDSAVAPARSDGGGVAEGRAALPE